MFTFFKRVSRFENRIDTSLEKFVFHHQFLGFFMIFVGMPLVTLAAVCECLSYAVQPAPPIFLPVLNSR